MPIVWDIYGEHLEEAGFLVEAWERAFDSPNLTLLELANGVERRLCAHVDALVLGGERVAERVLLPALTNDDDGVAQAAALALLATAEPAHRTAVLHALRQPDRRHHTPMVRALACAPAAAALRDDLAATLTADDASVRAAALDVLSFRRVLRADDLDPLRADSTPAVRAGLSRASARCPQLDLSAVVREELAATEPDRLAAALLSAAVLGLDESRAACRQARLREDFAGDTAWLLLSLSEENALLAECPLDRGAAIFALGFAATWQAADRCADCLRAGRHLELAFEAFTALTGASLPIRPRPDDDEPCDDRLAQDLPSPDVEAVLAWWRTHRDAYIRGSAPVGPVVDRTRPSEALRSAAMRRRHPAALRLSLLGAPLFETRASARHQLAALSLLEVPCGA